MATIKATTKPSMLAQDYIREEIEKKEREAARALDIPRRF